MKKKIYPTIFQKVVLFFFLMTSISINAYKEESGDFEVNGIRYSILNNSEAAVTFNEKYQLYSMYVGEDENGNSIYDDVIIWSEKIPYTGNITIPSTVTYGSVKYNVTAVGENAFSDCSELLSVSLPQGVKTIGVSAFNGCLALKSVIIPSSVTSIGASAFASCRSLVSISIPNGVTTIGNYAFSGCTNLTTISIPSSVTSVGANAFVNTAWYNNQPDGLIYIGKVAYKYKGTMPANTNITITNGTTTISDAAFQNCVGLASINIPNTVTTLGINVFQGCASLKSVNIPSSVKTIGNYVFAGCTALASVTISNSITNLGAYAFRGCTSLSSIVIPSSITNIGGNAFQGCSNLSTVTCEAVEPPVIYSTTFSNHANCDLKVPEVAKEKYASASYWNQFKSITSYDMGTVTVNGVELTFKITSLNDKTAQIGNGKVAAIPATMEGALTIPSSVSLNGTSYAVTSIADSAFYNCNKLTSVEVPASIKSSGNNSFLGCSGLQKLIVPNLAAWCSIAFVNKYSNPLYYAKHLYKDANTEITDLVIPNGVPNIEGYTFVKGLFKTLSIPGSVSEVRTNSFYKCTSLTTVQIAKGVNKVRTNAFYGCTALTSVSLPEGLARIGTRSFYQCTALESMELPSSIIEIATGAFSLCSNLKQVTSNILVPTAFGSDAFSSIAPDAVLYIPVGKMTAYVKAGWTNDVFGGGVVEVGDVHENFCLENGVTKNFIQSETYPNDDYSYTKITDYTTQSTSYRKDLPMPVVLEVPVTTDGNSLILETSADGTIVRTDTFCVGQRSLEIWNLIPQTEYTYRLYVLNEDAQTKTEVTHGGFTTEGQVRMMKVDNVRNFRDIGGWKLGNGRHLRYDRIFRSAELATSSQIITDAGIHEMLKVQGIGVEIDFSDYDGSPVSGNLDYYRGSDYQLKFYADGLKNTRTQYKNCFEKTVKGLREGKKVLFHCSAGADRTGGFAFLLEGLLGVSESDLAKDYELTSFVYDTRYRNGNNWKGLISYVKQYFAGNTLNEKIEQMALSFGISQKDIDDFRELMTVREIEATDVSALTDVIYANPSIGTNDASTVLVVNLRNAQTTNAYSFDLKLPDGVTVAKDENGDYVCEMSSRHDGHALTINYQPTTGIYSFATISGGSKVVKNDDGVALIVKLSVDKTVEVGDYALTIQNARYSLPSGALKVKMPEVTSLLTIGNPKKGDANGDSEIDIADAVCVVNYVVDIETPAFSTKGADADGDGVVDIADAVRIVNFVVGKVDAMARKNVNDLNALTGSEGVAEQNQLCVDDILLSQNGEGELKVRFVFDAAGIYSGYSFNLSLPEGLEFVMENGSDVAYTMGSCHDGSHSAKANLSKGLLKVAGISMSSAPLKGTDGVLITFKVKATAALINGQTLTGTIKDILLVPVEGQKQFLNENTFVIAQGKDYMMGDVNGDGQITAQDASLVLQIVAKKIEKGAEGVSFEAADVNGDGLITAQDASLILQLVAGKIKGFSLGE